MKFFNRLFIIVVFFVFCLPTNSKFYLEIGGILVSIREIGFILLPIINLLCVKVKNNSIVGKKIRIRVYFLILIVLFTEIVIKGLIYSQGIGNAIKTIRLGVPLISSLIILVQGLRPNIGYVWRAFILAIFISVLISFLSIIMNISFLYQDLEDGVNVIAHTQGRLINSNASFGIIALFLLLDNKNRWYNKGRMVKIALLFSVLSLVLTFNRTYWAILFLLTFYLILKRFKIKHIVKMMFMMTVFLLTVFYLYQNNIQIKNQLDNRVFSILSGSMSIAESTVDGNREIIYEGVLNRLFQGHWIIGLPYDIEIFTWPSIYGKDEREMTVTDTSMINILLRYGIASLLLVINLFKNIFWKDKEVKLIFIAYLLASLNVDSLMGQNSIFFLFIFLMVHKNDNKL